MLPSTPKSPNLMTAFVHYGCGPYAPLSWRNFDVSPTLRLPEDPPTREFCAAFGARLPTWPENVEYGDIVRGLPVAEGSCRAIYCSHVLEHLALEELRTALVNTLRYLKPGGIFRCVLPDLERLAREYLDEGGPEAASHFLRRTHLGQETRPRSPEARLRSLFGNAAHLWMWDYPGLEAELQSAGFVDIRRADFGDSEEVRFQEVEEEDRWRGCLGIECRRPSAS